MLKALQELGTAVLAGFIAFARDTIAGFFSALGKLPLTIKIVLVVVGVLGIAAAMWTITNKHPADEVFVRANYLFRVTIKDRKKTDKCLAQVQARLAPLSNTLSEQNLLKETAWSATQYIAASPKERPNDIPRLTRHIRSTAHPDCFCWQETVDTKGIMYHISGWAMYAFAVLKEPVTAADVNSMLAAQSSEGWWPIFARTDRQWASTYATAWMVLGLAKQLKTKGIPVEHEARVMASVESAANWLASQRKGSTWKLYPLSTRPEQSESISGLTVHALHMAKIKDLRIIDKSWLQSLPRPDVSKQATEGYNIDMTDLDGAHRFDRISQVKLPWMLVATADAYASGDWFERAAALRWIDGQICNTAVQNADSTTNPWEKAELLLSLNYLSSDFKL
jgi:hypothetical protein